MGPQPGSAAAAGEAAPRPGTVETLAGPGICRGPAVWDNESSAVRALGVDASGVTYVDVGSAGQVRKADSLGTVLVPTGIPVKATGPARPPVAGRLAPDEKGGFFVSAGAKILHLDAPRTQAPNVGINPGIIALETLAGDPASAPGVSGPASSGDGGPLAAARFVRVLSLATDEAGDVFLTEAIDERRRTFKVRFINLGSEPRTFYAGTPSAIVVAPGTIATIAGGAGEANTGDGVAAPAASLEGTPPALSAGPDRLYLGASFGGASARRTSVRMINLGPQPLRAHGVEVGPGQIATVAGGGASGFGGDGGAAREGRFSELTGLDADAEGNLYLADRANHRVRKVDSGGLLSTFAGTGSRGGGPNGHGLPANRALLERPFDVKAGPQGEVYVSDEGNALVRVVGRTGIIEPGPGNSKAWKCEGASGRSSSAGTPGRGTLSGVATTSSGSVFFNDAGGGRILKVTGKGRVEPAMNRREETVGDRRLSDGAAALAAAPGGGLAILRARLGGLVLFNPTREPLRAFGRQIAPGAAVEVVPGTDARSDDPQSGLLPPGLESSQVAVDGKGNAYVAQANVAGLTAVSPAGRIAKIAGPGGEGSLGRCCIRPAGVAADRADNLYVADPGTSRIWFINRGRSPIRIHSKTVAPGAAEPVAGDGTQGISGEGVNAIDTPLDRPGPITVDGKGNVYFRQGGEDSIRRIDAAGVLTTVVGSGSPGFNGDGLRGKLTALRDPTALAVDRCGNLLIADRGNDRIRRLNLARECRPETRSSAPRSDRPGSRLGGWGTALIGIVLASLAAMTVRKYVSRKKTAG